MTILICLFIVGWVTAGLIGTQAYFRGEQRKPIHERNWNNNQFDELAKSFTGKETEKERSYPSLFHGCLCPQ